MTSRFTSSRRRSRARIGGCTKVCRFNIGAVFDDRLCFSPSRVDLPDTIKVTIAHDGLLGPLSPWMPVVIIILIQQRVRERDRERGRGIRHVTLVCFSVIVMIQKLKNAICEINIIKEVKGKNNNHKENI